MKFRPQYAIINLGIEVLFVGITIVKILTWGQVGASWGISLALKQLSIPAEYYGEAD